MRELHRVVVVGAGFGGLAAVQGLKGAPVAITLIDRRNHHLFQPLLYQVATASLATSEIAWPVRHVVKRQKNVTTLLATVTGIDMAEKRVVLDGGGHVPFDTLVLATGARHAYFGHGDWEEPAPGLKTLEDAIRIRRRILLAFERAERESDPDERHALLTFVIVGAGPTGVELAGTIAELAHATLKDEFRRIDTTQARILLIEAGPRVLPSFEASLAAYANEALTRLGVEILTGEAVRECSASGVKLGDRQISARVILWAAGVEASPASHWLGAPGDAAGRVKVEPDLSVPGHPDIFVIGDTATIAGDDGIPVPGIAPAAKQQGRHVAGTIRARIAGHAALHFHYVHHGTLATIGKRAAVIDFGRIKLKGRIAWWLWGLAHIYFLIGVRNRLAVALTWLWAYARDDRSARLITQEPGVEGTV